MIFYRGFDNQNVDYRVLVRRSSCKVPENYDEKNTHFIRDSLKKELPNSTH